MTPDLPPHGPSGRRTPFEWSLAALRPADSGAERPSFMFKAGQASRDGEVRFWRWAAVGCGLLLAAGAGAGGWLIADATRRAEVAEARANRAENPTPQPPPRSGEGEQEQIFAATERSGGSAAAPFSRGEDTPPLPSPASAERPWERGPGGEGYTTPNPTPKDIAAALQLRRDILVAGLGMIPDGKLIGTPVPTSPGEWDRHWATPSGVLTTPKITPKKPTPIADPDDDVPPIPDRE
ncbi:MAG: hypothetical protein ABGY75_05275 [Gemmataceae bacterium]